MAPHPILVGDRLADAADDTERPANVLGRARAALDDARRLRLLAAHLDALDDRGIRFVSAFLGPATNTILPDRLISRLLAPRLAGRNRARTGITSWQPVHFPEATALAYAPATNAARVDVFACVVAPPDTRGVMSFGPANGANGDIVARLLDRADITLLLYVNDRYPAIAGPAGIANGIHVDQLARLANAERLVIVTDDTDVPAMPPDGFAAGSDVERRIGDYVGDHMIDRIDRTRGRALQVGIGGTGLQAVRRLRDSPWHGRLYTEMLDPVTWALVEDGTARGSHLVIDGQRRQLDDAVVATFAVGARGDGFYERLAAGPARLAPASVVLQPAAFHGGIGINNVLGIDFHGQVNATARDRNPWSGVGGAAAIHRGLAVGGDAYLCLRSTHRGPDGRRRSSIFPYLPRGTPVTLTGADLMGTRDGAAWHLVTEYGVAQINGNDQHELIRRLVAIAHPDFRAQLARAAAREFGLHVAT